MHPTLQLISHPLCPYVQRAAITLAEKNVQFERIDIDLANKPAWFLRISPLGKTPVLLVDGQAIFESAVICEYLDETIAPALHPSSALERAQHRGWIEFASATLNTIAGLYNAPDELALQRKVAEIKAKLAILEAVLGSGPYFSGEAFSLVDAAFGPVFRYFDVLDTLGDFDFFSATPKVSAWRKNLSQRDSVIKAVSSQYPELLLHFLIRRDSVLARGLNPVVV